MPTSSQVLETLTRASRDYGWLAAFWHVAAGVFLAHLASGWRPPRALAALLPSAPLLSVNVVSVLAGNPLNACVFGFLALGIFVAGIPSGEEPVRLSPIARRTVGVLLVAFAWVYPHFLSDGFTFRYFWAAPLGLVPCPSLSLAIGFALLLERPMPRPAALLLAGVGILYGLLGWLWLGVGIDIALLVASALFLVVSARTGVPKASFGDTPETANWQESSSAVERDSADLRG